MLTGPVNTYTKKNENGNAYAALLDGMDGCMDACKA